MPLYSIKHSMLENSVSFLKILHNIFNFFPHFPNTWEFEELKYRYNFGYIIIFYFHVLLSFFFVIIIFFLVAPYSLFDYRLVSMAVMPPFTHWVTPVAGPLTCPLVGGFFNAGQASLLVRLFAFVIRAPIFWTVIVLISRINW
jgi:hypothetical protein